MSGRDEAKRDQVQRLAIAINLHRRQRLNAYPAPQKPKWAAWIAAALLVVGVGTCVGVVVGTSDPPAVQEPRRAAVAEPAIDPVQEGCMSVVLLKDMTERFDVNGLDTFGVGASIAMVTTSDNRLNTLGGEVADAMIEFGSDSTPQNYELLLDDYDRYLARCRTLGVLSQ